MAATFREAAEAERRGPVIEGRRKRARVNYHHSPGDSLNPDDPEGQGARKGKGGKVKTGRDDRGSKDEDYELVGVDPSSEDEEDEEEVIGLVLKGVVPCKRYPP